MNKAQFAALEAWIDTARNATSLKTYETMKENAREVLCGLTAKPSGCERIGTNSGHGHAWERPDGVKARCGGPIMCGQCAMDKSLVERCEK